MQFIEFFMRVGDNVANSFVVIFMNFFCYVHDIFVLHIFVFFLSIIILRYFETTFINPKNHKENCHLSRSDVSHQKRRAFMQLVLSLLKKIFMIDFPLKK